MTEASQHRPNPPKAPIKGKRRTRSLLLALSLFVVAGSLSLLGGLLLHAGFAQWLSGPSQPIIPHPEAPETPTESWASWITPRADHEPAIQRDETPIPASTPSDPEHVPVADGQPRIWIPELAATDWVLDLGEIAADRATERDIVIVNRGRGDLLIDGFGPRYSTMAFVIADSDLDPGESTTARISVDPRVLDDPPARLRSTVRFSTNDPLAPRVELTFQALIVGAMTPAP